MYFRFQPTMKTLIIILLAWCLCVPCVAQDTTSVAKKVDHELSINTTFFIKQLVNLSNANLEISPYILGYKMFAGKKKQHGLRVSVGGDFDKKKELPDSTFVRIDKSNSIDYRIGYEYRQRISKAWTFFAGVDFRNSFSSGSSKVNSTIDIITTAEQGISFGGGPVIGIQVNLHKRISLFTETAFYYAYTRTKSKNESMNFPELNVNQVTVQEHKGSFMLPTSLYFVFRF